VPVGALCRSRYANRLLLLSFVLLAACALSSLLSDTRGDAFDIRSIGSGAWSDPATWRPRRRPSSGDRVLIQPEHQVVYDVASADVIRSIAAAGTLTFARDRDTELNVGVVTVFGDEPASDTADLGVLDVHAHSHAPAGLGGGALEVGTPEEPIPAPRTARIRLHYFEGMDRDAAPALICRPGGRMDIHGAPMPRTWLELGRSVSPGDTRVELVEVPGGWRAGDEVVITGSIRDANVIPDSGAHQHATEQRRIVSLDGNALVLDAPAERTHYGSGRFRSEVANLSRTVIVESATPDGVRGHTMYHRYARGSISYARFSGLGKEATLGRYPIHFHRVGDTMRGSSVVGAAIVDSHNRWLTIHGTEYMVVRDCVGFGSVGHGFFLEDGSEVNNVLDRNLGIGAHRGIRMKNQAMPYDDNGGAAFWWANGRNTFVRNVACENDRYGYRYEIQRGRLFSGRLPVRGAGGERAEVDIRSIPIDRFRDNESHTEARYSFSFMATDFHSDGEVPRQSDLERDPNAKRHPHVLRDLTAWQTNYALHVELPRMWIEDVTLDHAVYAVYRPWFEDQVFKNIHIVHSVEPFNRGFDDESVQHGKITVDGLSVEGRADAAFAVIQISDQNLSGDAESHFRNVTVTDEGTPSYLAPKPLIDRGGGPRPAPTTAHGVPIYLHDFFGPGRGAKVVSSAANDFAADGLTYREEKPITGAESRLADIGDIEFPRLLDPRDDQPPATIVTWPRAGLPVRATGGRLVVLGTTSDNEKTSRVVVNGVEAEDIDYNFHRWRATLTDVVPGPLTITATATDEAGNVEQTPHVLAVEVR